MKLALLDHPWSIDSALDGSSPGFQVLEQFENLVRKHGLSPVPFLNPDEYQNAWTRVDYQRHRRSSGLAALRRFAYALVRWTGTTCTATPNPEPDSLTEDWKQALRESALGNQWRSPQIVVPRTRKAKWPNQTEIEIVFDDCVGENVLPSDNRVLVVINDYDHHPFALSDFDPWDLRHVHPVAPGAPEHQRHPCRLPRPPINADLSVLKNELNEARGEAWGRRGKYYFIPAADWDYATVSRQSWRQGRAFSYRKCQHSNRNGYIDAAGREWVWDQQERHWDVQTQPYVRINHAGDMLD